MQLKTVIQNLSLKKV